MKLVTLTVAAIAVCAAACASKPVPTARVASAEAAVRAANEVGAPNVPDAQMHLRMANDQLGHAKKLIKDGDYDDGEWYLARAQADAEVAVALAREAQQRAAAQQAVTRVREMANTMPRSETK